VHLGDHPLDILGIDRRFHLAEQPDQRLAIGGVWISVGSQEAARVKQEKNGREDVEQ